MTQVDEYGFELDLIMCSQARNNCVCVHERLSWPDGAGHLPAYALQAAAAPDWRTLVSAQAGQETSADARSFLQELQ